VDRATPRDAADERSHESGTLAQRIAAASPAGERLMPDVQDRLETALQFDLADLRVHTGSEADRLARSVDAKAFTSGRDIFFRHGAYVPGSPEGFTLLAHEATHTVQQAEGPVAGTPTAGGISLSDPSDPYERAAERAAAAAAERDAARGPAALSHGSAAADGAVARATTVTDVGQLPAVARMAADEPLGHHFARVSVQAPRRRR
jgi:hypothetical protein